MSHGRGIVAWLAFAALVIAIPSANAKQKYTVEAVPGEYIVKLKDSVFQEHSIQALDLQLQSKVVRKISKASRSVVVQRPMIENASFALTALKKNPNVEYVEPNFIYRAIATPDDPDLSQLWGLINIGQEVDGLAGRAGIDVGAEQAWDIQTGDRSIIVAVIDTGVNYEHPDLAENMWVNTAELNGVTGVDDDNNGYVDDIHGYDFANKDGDPMDDHGHGSHCAGTIGAKGNDGKGIVGVAWDVQIMGVKFLTASGGGSVDAAISAIDYAVEMGANILSNSWGGGSFSKALEEAVQRSSDAGAVFVAAAGNDGANNDSVDHYPSNYDVENVISVAAINNKGNLASFSNYGKERVHLAAPGVDIYSSTTNDGYNTWSGTSMAAPHVSGVTALLLSEEESLTPVEVKERLMATSRPLASLRGILISGGVVNAFYALKDEAAPADERDPFNWTEHEVLVSTPHPYKEKKELTYTVEVPGATRFAVYFEKFETEANYDKVTFRDGDGNVVGSLSGLRSGTFSPVVEGDTMTITIKSDRSVNGYGFDITKAHFE